MDERDDQILKFDGTEVEVTKDLRRCMAAGECNRAAGELFVKGRTPWCQPDREKFEEVVKIIQRCPSGALAVVRKDGKPVETPEPVNVVVVSNNGPLYLSGDLAINGAKADMPAVRFRAALCRCGQSQCKPFCDDTHEDVKFDDSGPIGLTGQPYEGEGGPLKVTCVPNGPLLLSGKFSMMTGSGRLAWRGTQAALCRCGTSKNMPFCDGSHVEADFKAE